MARRPMAEAMRAMSAELIHGSAETSFDTVCIDSRRVEPGSLFFALEGERTDGHRFVDQAIEAGAAGVVVHRRPASLEGDPAVLLVDDTFAALHDLTRAVRDQVPRSLVGITGSAGKTTTKEYLVALLSTTYRAAGSPGNYNTLYGFPLSLLALEPETEWMVAELGMSTPGELAEVSRLARPDVALFTNVRRAHLEGFESEDGRPASVRDIAEAKAGLLEGLVPGGLIVANRTDPEVTRIVERYRDESDDTAGVVWYEPPAIDQSAQLTRNAERSVQAQVWVEDVVGHPDGVGFDFVLCDRLTSARAVGADENPEIRRTAIRLPAYGRVNVANFTAAAACALALGVDPRSVTRVASDLGAATGRGRLLHGSYRTGTDSSPPSERQITVIDDSYNSNPDAAVAALESARALPGTLHVCVLGDMLELGAERRAMHREVGATAGRLGFDRVVAVGEMASEVASAAQAESPNVEVVVLPDVEAAIAGLEDILAGTADVTAADTVVLIKGSRGISLEKLVGALSERLEEGEVN